ncbi:hypothetical protein ISN76_02615 [Dyella halodurans]|uniref:Glycine zipper domain-containing protein n=1 Tax=Dyella halodurans TaxID=1920171 RepID=A0ABV9BXA5_9GAMM|nr:hypothetical protein [Dyella halodurans]
MKWKLPIAFLLVAVTPLSHAASVRADKLPAPKNMTCLQMKQDISYTIKRGLLHIPWDYEVGRGAYISEHEDDHGVYYRAPSGAITLRRADLKESSTGGRRSTFEGGIYVPNDPAVAPTLYEYYGTFSGSTRSAPDKTDCSTLSYSVDPATHKVNVWAMGAATGIGAATGMAIHPQVHTSYGQAAGAGLVGGLIGGLIIGAIENSKAGEIVAGPPLDEEAGEKIRALATDKIAMTVRGQAGNTTLASATPAGSSAPIATTRPDVDDRGPASASSVSSMPVAGQAASETAVATIAMASAPIEAQAQSVASQLGCGAVKAGATGGYVAPCGSYGVYIDCDTGRCRPSHTVKLEGSE